MSDYKGLKKLQIMVYLMGYTMIFGMFFICYILYQENENMHDKKSVSCKEFNYKIPHEAQSLFYHKNKIYLLFKSKAKTQEVYVMDKCNGKMDKIGKLEYSK